MHKVAIIAAAGWKGVGGPGMVNCPAPFLPLGDGTTMLSRLSKQLQAHDLEVVITVGPLGYPFRAYQPRGRNLIRHESESIEGILAGMGVDPDDSPWIPERHAYAAEHGKLVIVPDPGWRNQHDSFCEAMDALPDGWGHLVLVCGDTLFSTHFLGEVMAVSPWNFQFSMHHNHAIFLLDESGAGIYRAYTEAHRKRSPTQGGWVGATRLYPDGGIGTGKLGILGIEHCGWHTPPWCDLDLSVLETFWRDVDNPVGYGDARVKIQKGWFA